MKKLSIALSFFLLFNSVGSAWSATLQAGTPVMLTVDSEIDADDVKKGDMVSLTVQAPVKDNGIVVIPANTPVLGQVTRLKNNFIFGKPGLIEVGNLKLKLDENRMIPLKATLQDKGNSRYSVLFGLILWITTPLIFVKGDDGKIPKGLEVLSYTAQEIEY